MKLEEKATDFLAGDLNPQDMLPTSGQSTAYNTLSYATFALFCLVALGKTTVMGVPLPAELTNAETLSFLVGIGPVL